MKPDPSTTLERVSAVHRSEHPRYGTRDYKAVMIRIILPKGVHGCALYAGAPADRAALTVASMRVARVRDWFPAIEKDRAALTRHFATVSQSSVRTATCPCIHASQSDCFREGRSRVRIPRSKRCGQTCPNCVWILCHEHGKGHNSLDGPFRLHSVSFGPSSWF